MLQLKQVIDNTQQSSQRLRQLLSCKCQDREEVEVDQRLAQWIQGLGLHESAQKLFLSEGFTLEEVLYDIDINDLHRVGLRGGSEFRIWRAILAHRNRASPYSVPLCNGTASDETETV